MSLFRFGTDTTIRLDVPEDVLVGEFVRPRGAPIADVQRAAEAALRKPVDFPPLSKAVVPRDKLADAVSPDVPQASQIIPVVVAVVVSARIAAEDICKL